ncbi:hypothetical protein CGCSCA5_v012563 [Colletotrichum siamense]|nr:hypothetical protein CGCSCA5_v012563 [Colletotrichum siamense]
MPRASRLSQRTFTSSATLRTKVTGRTLWRSRTSQPSTWRFFLSHTNL